MYEEYSNEHREYIRKERITKNAVTISRIIILSAIFALWEIARI